MSTDFYLSTKNQRYRCLVQLSAPLLLILQFRRQFEYKAAMYGRRVVVADRWHPSLKTCSKCRIVLAALLLSIREWDCLDCSAHHDRDVNAAKILMKLAMSSTIQPAERKVLALALRPR